MTHYICIYPGCCFYEITALCYFLNFSGSAMTFLSPDGQNIRCAEGFVVEADGAIAELEPNRASAVIVPGGTVEQLRGAVFSEKLRQARRCGAILCAICAGVDLLDEAGLLRGIASTHSEDVEWARADGIITARANAFLDFAIETAKTLKLFRDEADYQETVAFWKQGKRMQ